MFHHLPNVGSKQLCALAHLGFNCEVGTSSNFKPALTVLTLRFKDKACMMKYWQGNVLNRLFAVRCPSFPSFQVIKNRLESTAFFQRISCFSFKNPDLRSDFICVFGIFWKIMVHYVPLIGTPSVGAWPPGTTRRAEPNNLKKNGRALTCSARYFPVCTTVYSLAISCQIGNKIIRFGNKFWYISNFETN